MKRFVGRVAVAVLALAVAGAPAMAGGRGGYWGGGGYGGGHHHHGGGGSSSGWWIGGAVALTTIGLLAAANSQPAYVQTGVYSSGVGYTSPPLYTAPVYGPVYEAAPVYGAPVYEVPPVYGAPVYDAAPVYSAPVYEAPPVAYSVPVPQTPPVVYAAPATVYAAAAPANTALANATSECNRWAMNQSGHDPSNVSPWTTQIMVDSYNRARDSCMQSRGYRAY